MRSEWYGCSRTCSHSSLLRRAGLSHTALETATRPTSCSSPAISRSVLVSSGSRSCSAGPTGQRGNRTRMAEQVGALQVGQVPEHLGDQTRIRHRHVRGRFGVEHDLAHVRRVEGG